MATATSREMLKWGRSACACLFAVAAVLCSFLDVNATLGQVRIEFEPVMQLGKAESEISTELFGSPQRVAVDESGRIFVADYPRIEVLVYGPDGSHITNIGARGRGPGELSQVASIATSPIGELVVADGFNMKFVRFALDGSVVAERGFAESEFVRPAVLESFGSGYLTYYLPPTGSNRTEVLHIYSEDLSEINESFGELREIWDPGSEAQRAIAGNPRGARVAVWGDRVCIASRIYEGTIACYRRNGNEFHFFRLAGAVPADSYKIWREGDEVPPLAWRINGPEGRLAISGYSSSRGFAVTDTSLTHFTVRKVRTLHRLFAEVFDDNGKLQHSGIVDNYEPFERDETPLVEVLHSTKDGSIYLTDQRDGFPVLKVVRLRIR